MRRLAAFTATAALAFGACFSPGPVSSPTASGSAVVIAPATEFDAAKAKAHVDYLADAARGGRYSGSPGYRDAATYVADRFREIGLEPLGDTGTFFQHFSMPIVDLTEMSTLTGPGGKTFRPRVDFTESVGGRSGSGKAEAEIAAVGGAARGGGLNDFAGANVRGKIALVTGPGAPSGGNAVENAYQEGAIGVLVIGGATLRYSYLPRFQTETVPTLVISQEAADQLLAPAGRTVS
ncbi:MAG TPA: PA domain-containing protein, partial [Candidatus Limnocylindria bacterium]|nr:PA domain-containing protein [Candidatus Limnocylindria bacterium]